MASDSRDALAKGFHAIPASWAWEWFTDVMDVDGGTQPPASVFISEPRSDYVRLVQIRDFESDKHLTFIPDSHKWRKCSVSDVLIGRYGAALGRICTGLAGAYNVALAKVVPAEKIHLPFAYHLLRSSYFQGPLLAGGGRSAQAGFNKEGLSVIRLPIPPLPEQRAIAHVLGTLDDKIELNRRRNQTLEAMARALFKDWFVDFGPVRAKMEGCEPYLPAALWQLFPELLDDEGKPEGWQAGRLDDALILQRGFDLPAPGRTHGAYPVMAASGLNGYHNQFMVKGPGITTGRSGVLGRVFYVHTDFWPLNTSLWVKEFKSVSPLYAFELLRGLDFEMFNAGSAVPTLNRNHVHNLPIVLPPKQLIDTFDEQVSPMREAQKHCEDECGFLAQLRDTLLPKLISGELRIKNAERFLAETV